MASQAFIQGLEILPRQQFESYSGNVREQLNGTENYILCEAHRYENVTQYAWRLIIPQWN